MNEEDFSRQIQELMEIPTQMDYSGLVFELVGIALLLPALFIIFKYSQRPGRIMMFFGYLFSTLSYLPVAALFYSEGQEGFDGVSSWLILYLPTASLMFGLVACVGFLMFALSFKNES